MFIFIIYIFFKAGIFPFILQKEKNFIILKDIEKCIFYLKIHNHNLIFCRDLVKQISKKIFLKFFEIILLLK